LEFEASYDLTFGIWCFYYCRNWLNISNMLSSCQLDFCSRNNLAVFINWREGFHGTNPHTEHAVGAALINFDPGLIKIDGIKRADGNTRSTKIAFVVDNADHEGSVECGLPVNLFTS
jgi:hypothetical protein